LKFSINSSAENYYALGGRLIIPAALEAHVFANTGNNLYSRSLLLVIGDDCAGDFDGDGDIDGSNLAELLNNPGGLDLLDFLKNFGNTYCYE
jgi:hypothetical protein